MSANQTTAWRAPARCAARLLAAILIFGGVQRLCPFMAWWGAVLVGVACLYIAEYGYTGSVTNA